MENTGQLAEIWSQVFTRQFIGPLVVKLVWAILNIYQYLYGQKPEALQER